MSNYDYSNQLEKCAQDSMIRRVTVKESIDRQMLELTERQKKVARLQQLLEENPLFEEFLNLTREIL